MIYTLTVNPAIDYHMDLTGTGFIPGQINRSAGEMLFPGGKGLNVSVVLARLGIKSTAWGFVAGRCGRMLEELAREKGCDCDFIYLPGETRINVKLDCEEETAINGNGPVIRDRQVEELLSRIRNLSFDDTLILSGNLQAGGIDLYEAVCREAAGQNVRLIVDTEGENLKNTFRFHPFLIKPNEEELLGLFAVDNGEGRSKEEVIISLMHKCREDGAENVLVTRGGDGALLLTQDGDLFRSEITGSCHVVSTVGAGDSAVAGFLAGLKRYDGQYEKALQLSCAAGTATAGTMWLGSTAQIEKWLESVDVQKV